MKNALTYFPFCFRYYLLRPWEFARQCKSNLKAAWQRATKGYADRDVWNLDTHLLTILPAMLDTLREKSHGYPAHMKNEEEWFAYLSEISTHLRNAANEPDWENWEEWNKNAVYREEEVKKALTMMAEHWFALWD